MTDVVTVGEPLVAFVATEPGPWRARMRFEGHVAGAELNVAVGLARLGHASALVGRVGDDGLGALVASEMRAENVDATHLGVEPGAPTGILVRQLRTLGAAEVVYYRAGSAGARLSPEHVHAAAPLIRGARFLHLTGITPALSPAAHAAWRLAAELARDAGVAISLDVNYRSRLWSQEAARAALAPLVPLCAVVLADESEAALLAERPARLVLKQGPRGARLDDGPHDPGFPLPVPADPVGAGDAFAAGWLSAALDGLEPPAALRRANACGAFAVSALGDSLALPTRADLERLLSDPAADSWR